METANTLTYDGVLQLAGEFANASPERQQQIRGTLGQWRQADRLRQEQELAAQQESVDRFFLGQFTNDQEFQQSADHPAVHLAESHSDDPGQVKYTALGQSFLSSLLGRDVTGFEYQYQRDGYSLARFGRKPANDSEFRDMVAGELRTRQAQKTAWEDLQGQVVVNALRDAAEGRETLLAPTFQKWTETHRDLVDEESETGFLTQSLKFQKAILADMQRLRVPAANVWRTLTAFTQGGATDEDVLTLGRDLSGLSREDRQKIYGYSALAAAASGIDRSTFEQFAKNLGESVSRSFDFIGKGNLTSQEDGVRLWLNELRRGNVQMGESGNPRFAAPGQPGTRPLTEDERAALEKRFSETLPMFQVARELKAVAREQIDPIKPVFAANTGLGLAERGLYGLAGSTGFLAASAILYTFGIGGFMAYQAEEEDRIRVENPDINPQTAKALSIAEAAGNVLLDRMQLKRLPVLAGLAREVRVTGWGRAARKAGLVWGEQTAQELAQNAIAPVFETIASAMRSDMTPRDAGQEFSRYIEDIPATLAATGWLALIGGGFASVRDIKNPQADVDVALRHWGFSAEQSRRIKAAATPEAFDEAVREEMPRRTPEDIAAGRREAETAWRQAQQQQADPAQPKLEAIVRGERGTEWIVRDSEGRETLRTPNSETAQLALAELQQSAARRRQASMLRFSKSGDQAENVGRMWVELARDKRTMQHGETSDAKNLGTLLTEISPEAGQDVQIDEQKALNGQNDGYVFTGSDGGEIKVGRYVQDEYFFDTQNAGEHSTPINQAAYAWALNNGNKMVEDPGGLLYLGVLRRTSQMLSAALRAGTTRHMEPGPYSKITGWREEKSEADFFHNVGLLAMKEAELVHERLKGLDALRYDGESQAFYDGEHRIPAEEIEAYLGERIAGVDSSFSQRIGPATLRRALATLFAEKTEQGNARRLVGDNAEASAVLHRIRYVRKDRGEQEVPGSGSTEARGEPAEVSGGTRRPRDNGGVSREQARQWVDEVLRKWGSQLDVTVHESAEDIPDAAMRDRVLGEGDVEGFYFGADRRVHVLADQIRSRDRVEPLLKHEGFHWVVDGPLKAEYESLRQWAREQIPADKLEQLRKSYPEEVVVEEYLAHLAETNPKSTTWQRFVYEFRRLLRRVLGDRVEFTEEDLRAFLAKAQKRVERAGSQKRGDVHTVEALREGGDDLKPSRSARALLDGDKPMPTALALQAMREAPDHPVTRALKSWFVGGFRDIQNGKAPETEAILRKFLLRLPPYESKTPLYRGVPFRNEPELRAFLKQFQGDEWVNTKPFMSTTKKGGLAYDLIKNSPYNVVLEIWNGLVGRDIEQFAELAPQYGWQKEVLYSRDATFRIVEKPKLIKVSNESFYYIKLEEIE